MRRSSMLVLAAALVAVAFPALANPTIMKKAKDEKKEGVANCASCHVGAPKDVKLTPLGEKFKTKK